MLSPSDRPIALLPQDRELIAVLGCNEAEYRQFVRDCIKYSRLEPGKPVNFLVIPLLIQLVIGLALSFLASLLLRPKAPKSPDIRQSNQQGQNVVGRSEFAPKAGFDSLQNVVELGSTIPLVYANRETIDGVTYGGVRVNTNMLWSQMMSLGGSQMLRAVCLLGEAELTELDPAQFAFGDNVLGGYDLSTANNTSSRVTFYTSLDGGRLVGTDRVAGRDAANDTGNSENVGGPDVFAIPGINNTWTTDFCYSFKPSTQTQFGVYQLIGNGLAFRVNPSMRPTVQVRTEPVGKKGNIRLRCDADGVGVAQRDKYNTLFSSRSGVTRVNGATTTGTRGLAVGDTITYELSAASEAARIFVGNQPGTPHEETCLDVAQTVSGRQRGWDDALSIGDLYKFGSALLVCESRSPADEIFVSEADQEPIGGGQDLSATFRVVKAGTAVINGTEATSTATATSHIFQVAIASFALPRSAQVVELGFRSSLGVRINGICNFRDSRSHTEIDGRACSYYDGRVYGGGQSLELSSFSSGNYSGSETRYSFFKLGYRIAGGTDDYTYLSQCFGMRSVTQQAVYNFMRVQMPSLQRWEFRMEPLSGWEIRNGIVTGTLEVLDARISGYRTVVSGDVTVLYSGEPVARTPETFRIAPTKDGGLGVTLGDADDYADTWGRLAEAFIFEEMQTSARQPEHELVYVNLLAPNPNIPNYDQMALVGVNLRSSTEFSQLSQLSGYVNKGLLGGIHTFPEVFQDLLTNDRYGVGSVLSAEQIDGDAFKECAAWTRNRRYFFDGALAQPTNLRQWGSQTAGYFLLDLVIRGGRFSLQPAVYFDRPEPITNLYTAGNIIEDSFEFAYVDADQRTPSKVSVKWRQEKASTDASARGLFPVIREVTVRESSTGVDAPVEALDLTDFCTSEKHAIDVAKFICRGRRLTTHSVRFKTVPTQAALEVGRCFKLGLETIAYSQPNNGAIDANGVITSTEPLADGTYEVLMWRGNTATNAIEEVDLEVQDQRSSLYRSAVFCIKQSVTELRTYKVQSLGFDEDGNVAVEALYFPLLENDYSVLVEGWDAASNWIIEGAVGASEASTATTPTFTGVSLVGPGTVTTGKASTFTAMVSGGTGSYTYSWSGGVTFSSPSSATTSVTKAADGTATITCTVSNGATSHTASKTITSKTTSTAGTIGTVTITGSDTATVGVATSYTASFSGTVAAAQVLYGWDVDLEDVTITGSGQAAASITFEVAGTYIVSCLLNSASASDGPVRQTKTVTVT